MTAVRIDGKALAEKVRAQVADDVRAYGEPVCLATILVGDDPASHVYVGSKHKASHEAGIESRDHRFPVGHGRERDPRSHRRAERGRRGRRHPRPAPAARAHGRADGAARRRSREGRRRLPRPRTPGLLYLGEPFLVPATPSGVMVMLAEHGVELKGKEAVVIGRSEIVGKPMAMLLLAEHATVTICHSRTVDLAAHTRRADILVAAVGRRRARDAGHGEARRRRHRRRR